MIDKIPIRPITRKYDCSARSTAGLQLIVYRGASGANRMAAVSAYIPVDTLLFRGPSSFEIR